MLTEEQKKNRRLGGSTIAAAIGLSRYRTPLDAYLELTAEKPEEKNFNTERGDFLEPALLEWSKHRHGIDWVKPTTTLIRPDNPWFTFTPDGLDSAGTKLLEIKAPGIHTASQWGEDGSVDVPQEYLLQGVWGMFVGNLDEAVFAALIAGDLRTYRLKRDLELEAKVVQKATDFIEHHVLSMIPPAAVYGDSAALQRMYPKNELPHIRWEDLTDFQRNYVIGFIAARDERLKIEKTEETYRTSVQELIGPTAGIEGLPENLGGKRIDWKTTKAGMNAGTWKALAESFLNKLSKEEAEALLKQFTPTTGGRRLAIY